MTLLILNITLLMGTEIYGTINEDTTIGPEGNPWYVPYNLTVNEDVIFTILPGVEMYITAAYTDDLWNFYAPGGGEVEAKVITIYGTIRAIGTEADSIRFTRYPDYPDFRWGGLRIISDHSEESYFKHCIVEYSAFYNDGVNPPSSGISSSSGIAIKFCRFIDNYTGIRIRDNETDQFSTIIYGCSFYNTSDKIVYYSGDYDQGIRIRGSDINNYTTQIIRCEFNGTVIDAMHGDNDIINCNFYNIQRNRDLDIDSNHDFYGNSLSDSDAIANQISTIFATEKGVFKRNSFNRINPVQFDTSVEGYKNVSDNYFYDSNVMVYMEPDGRFYNNIEEYSDIDTYCDYEESISNQLYNNFVYNSGLSFRGYGDCYFYNNVIHGEDSGTSFTINNDVDVFYGINNYIDWWCLRPSFLSNEGEYLYHYNNICNDIDNYVEEHFERVTYPFYNNFLTYNMPDFLTDCGGNLENMDIALAGVVIDTLAHTFTLADSSVCIDAGYADTTFCTWDYNYNFSPFDGDGDGIAVVDIGPVEYGSYFNIGYVKCTVTDMEGLPLDIIRGEVADQCVEYTGLDGSFVMALPVGDYNLLLESPFYASDSLIVEVEVADTSFVSISLEGTYPFLGNDEDEIVIENGKLKVKNYPNPFNPETTITFSLPVESMVELVIYNIKGQQIRTMVKQNYSQGEHKVKWDGKDGSGQISGSGVYLYSIRTSSGRYTGKMVMLK
jgi:hypothetical protein